MSSVGVPVGLPFCTRTPKPQAPAAEALRKCPFEAEPPLRGYRKNRTGRRKGHPWKERPRAGASHSRSFDRPTATGRRRRSAPRVGAPLARSLKSGVTRRALTPMPTNQGVTSKLRFRDPPLSSRCGEDPVETLKRAQRVAEGATGAGPWRANAAQNPGIFPATSPLVEAESGKPVRGRGRARELPNAWGSPLHVVTRRAFSATTAWLFLSSGAARCF